MGSLVWNADPLILIPLQTMLRAEQYKDWESAAQTLFKLSKFLLGYGQGVDIPAPPKYSEAAKSNDIRGRVSTQGQYYGNMKRYYQAYSPDIMQRIGMYISQIMTQLQKQNNPYAQWENT